MISDGQGYNGWLASDYYQHGLEGQQSYQQLRPDGTRPIHVAKAQRPSFFVDVFGESIERADLTGQGLLTDEFVVPPNAVAMGQQHYDPESFWTDSVFEQQQGRFMDSAASATALASGSWTVNGRLNTSWDVNSQFETITNLAKEQAKKVGVVTTVQVSHATPAGMLAKEAKRSDYTSIFRTMFEELDLMMGCGHPLYDNCGAMVFPDDELAYRFLGGEDFFYALKNHQAEACFFDSFRSFQMLAKNPIFAQKLLAIAPVHETLQQRRLSTEITDAYPSGLAPNQTVPSLRLMSQAALKQLGQTQEGFFLMIEGGAVDWAHHANDFAKALEEQVDFNHAVDAVIDWVEKESSWQETLLIVTADHETGALWGEVNLPEGEQLDLEQLEHHLSAPINQGKGVMPNLNYLRIGHSNNLVPLWALGAGSECFLETNLRDPWAASLWGQPYNWDGRFVEATRVFEVMKEAMQLAHFVIR